MITNKLSIVPPFSYPHFENSSDDQTAFSAMFDYKIYKNIRFEISGYVINADNQTPKGINVFVRTEF